MRAMILWRAKAACWFLAMRLAVLAGEGLHPASAPASSPSTNRPSRSVKSSPAKAADDSQGPISLVAPRPAPTYRSDLRPAFTKKAPATLDDLRAMEHDIKALAARVSPAVVAVEVGSSSGSGVVISADGLVLTAGHVCGAPGRSVRFTFPDGKSALGKTLGSGPESDSGLMRITDRGHWPHAEMGDLRQARVGDWVLALGHPGGFDLRRSLVVRLGRIIRMDPGALQTDCTISPGDSGGPLFDMHGRVIGIHNAISRSTAENFHVAITAYYHDWVSLVKPPDETVPAAKKPVYVGAQGVDDTDGCRLTIVEKDSPAAKAGLKVGDVVVKVDGREVKYYASFLRWMGESEPGETLNLEIKRGDQLLSVEVKVEEPPRRH